MWSTFPEQPSRRLGNRPQREEKTMRAFIAMCESVYCHVRDDHQPRSSRIGSEHSGLQRSQCT